MSRAAAFIIDWSRRSRCWNLRDANERGKVWNQRWRPLTGSYISRLVYMIATKFQRLYPWPPSLMYDIPRRRAIFALVEFCCLTPKTWVWPLEFRCYHLYELRYKCFRTSANIVRRMGNNNTRLIIQCLCCCLYIMTGGPLAYNIT